MMTGNRADRCKVPQAFWRAAERAGLPPTALLRQARLPAALHVTPEALVTTAQYFALFRAVEVLSGDPAIGLKMTMATETALHPPATMSAFFARDYRDGLNRLARFKHLCAPEELLIEEGGRECRITWRWLCADGPEPDAVADLTFAMILELGRRGTGQPIRPLRVEMARQGPATADHLAYFGAPVATGRTRNALVLDRDDLDLPFAGHNPELLAILTPALAASLDEITTKGSLADQAKIVIKRRIASGRPDIAEVARELGLSERSLQRRIAETGATFRGLLDEARRELGRQLLREPGNGVDEVAFLLGFQDTNSFYRAFRAWEGVTPAQWRSLH